MEDLVTFYKVLLGICSGIAAIWGTIKIIKEIHKPNETMRENVEELDDRVTALETNIEDLKKEMKEYTDKEVNEVRKAIDHHLTQFDRLNDSMEGVLESLLAIGNHLVSGNEVSKIKKANDKIISTLIKHERDHD